MASTKAESDRLIKLYKETGNEAYRQQANILRSGGRQARARKTAELARKRTAKGRRKVPGAVAGRNYVVRNRQGLENIAAELTGFSISDPRTAAFAQELARLNGGIRVLQVGETLKIPSAFVGPEARASSRFVSIAEKQTRAFAALKGVTGPQDVIGQAGEQVQDARNPFGGVAQPVNPFGGGPSRGVDPGPFGTIGQVQTGPQFGADPSIFDKPAPATQFRTASAQFGTTAKFGVDAPLERATQFPGQTGQALASAVVGSRGLQGLLGGGDTAPRRNPFAGRDSGLAARAGGLSPGAVPSFAGFNLGATATGANSRTYALFNVAKEFGLLGEAGASQQYPGVIGAVAANILGIEQNLRDLGYNITSTGYFEHPGFAGAKPSEKADFINDALFSAGLFGDVPSNGTFNLSRTYQVGRARDVMIIDDRGAWRPRTNGGSVGGQRRRGGGGTSRPSSGAGGFGYIGAQLINWRGGFG